MDKLAALDANFLYTETDEVMNQIGSVQYFELPEGITPSAFVVELRKYLSKRLHLVPYMTRKLKDVPGSIDHPVWVNDEHFDISNHVLEIPVDAPGGHAEMEAKIAEIHSQKLDRSRPLWHIFVLTGLADGRVVYYNQVHHSCVDGLAGQAAIVALSDTSPEHPEHQLPENFNQKEEVKDAELLELSIENILKYQLGYANRTLNLIESMMRLTQRAMNPGQSFGAASQAPPDTFFNRPIRKARAYACGDLPLAGVKQISKAMGCTLNDTFMAICAGGLRRYLDRKNELPDTDLLAGCPVSLRRPGSTNQAGNDITMMSVSLFTTVRDSRLRLLKIHESSVVGKEVTSDMALAYDNNASIVGLPLFIRSMSSLNERTRWADRAKMPFNVVISNVPGPRNTLYSNGARMLTHYPVSIPTHGLGVNITVQSYTDGMYFGITSCRDAMADPATLRNDMLDAFAELHRLIFPDVVTPMLSERVLAEAASLRRSQVPVRSGPVAATRTEKPGQPNENESKVNKVA